MGEMEEEEDTTRIAPWNLDREEDDDDEE